MNKYKVTSPVRWNKEFLARKPTNRTKTCEVCKKIVPLIKTYHLEEDENPYVEIWICSEECVNMYILQYV
jgi:hypothetical protein